jgi:hypothetical protein
MSEIIGFTYDFADMEKKLSQIMKSTLPEHTNEGLRRMANEIIKDALDMDPTVPRGHARAKAGKRSGVGGTLRQSHKVDIQPDGTVILGFDTPYAAYQHEGQRQDGSRVIKNWSTPGSGKKFIQKKIEQFIDVYLKNMAEYIRRQSGE